MAQLSFYSAEANQPCVGDLAGLLCCHGQLTGFARTAARLSVALEETWRVRAVAAALSERGIDTSYVITEDGCRMVRTAFRADLIALADEWTKEDEKFPPSELTLDGGALRLWVLAAGTWLEGGYLLGLDPLAPDIWETVNGAVARCGLPATLESGRDAGPGLRISGRRRLARLAELVGRPPFAAAESHWPAGSRVRQSA